MTTSNGDDLKKALFGNYQRTADWQDSLAKKVAHKGLDIAEDDVNIDASKTGVSTGGLIAAVGIPTTVVGALAIAAMLLMRPQPTPTPTTQPAAPLPTWKLDINPMPAPTTPTTQPANSATSPTFVPDVTK